MRKGMTEKTCPRCGFVAPIQAKKCPRCGLEPRPTRRPGERKPYIEAAVLAIAGFVLLGFAVNGYLAKPIYSRVDVVLALGGLFFLVWAFNVARDKPMD